MGEYFYAGTAEDLKKVYEGLSSRMLARTAEAALAALRSQYPDATIVAGGTDVGLWVTKQLRDLSPVAFLSGVRDLQQIEEQGMKDLGDIAAWVPGLHVVDQGGLTVRACGRGDRKTVRGGWAPRSALVLRRTALRAAPWRGSPTRATSLYRWARSRS
ncbi:MAG: hypothetical protein HC793_05355, partial [Aquincola sp.]|nr:hypothetical protein [Aquincola sp.]